MKNNLPEKYPAEKQFTPVLFCLISFFIPLFFLFSGTVFGQMQSHMQQIDEYGLEKITAQAGIVLFIDTAVQCTADAINISDTDSSPASLISFQGVSIDDNSGGPFAVATPFDNPVTIDITTNMAGQTLLAVNLSQFYQPSNLSVINIDFCGQALGSLDIDELIMDQNYFEITTHLDESMGIDWQYLTKIDIGQIKYTSNSAGDSFTASGIHLSQTSSGAPHDPSAWDFAGGFQIGDFEDQPATYDLGTNATGQTVMFLTLPMDGALRVEDINFNQNSFGPMAIDGIHVHRLLIGIVPFE